MKDLMLTKAHSNDLLSVGKIDRPASVFFALPAEYKSAYANNTLANKDLFVSGIGNLTADQIMDLARKAYNLAKVNTFFVIPTKNKGVVKIDNAYLGTYAEAKGIKTIKINVDCADNVFDARVHSARSIIRRYHENEWKRPYKWNADMKTYDGVSAEEADGVDIINYITYVDREIYIDLVGKTKPHHIKVMQQYKLHYKINGLIINPFIKAKGEPTPFEEAYMKVYAVDEVDAEHFFVKETKDNLDNPEVILNTFAGVYTYESFRNDLYCLGFSDIEINKIGRILMNAIRFVDQIEPLYEDSTEE